MEIAVYGKGGIGKSTVSANLSAALALRGHRVLQIGCDPKHDSTRLLTHGKEIETVLDYLRHISREEENPAAVLAEGFGGVGCIEAGGPKPGVGCAGRGIISAFEFLKRHAVKEKYDTVLYDVLGDVVCGGFAVPVRREYADVIFLVTSGEFMALYAANNILRGILNFDGDRHKRVAGIIYNERKIAEEDERVRRFADAVGLPVLVKVPRSNAFAAAEEKKMPLMELPGFPEEKAVFETLADLVGENMNLFGAKPLSDEKLEEVVLSVKSSGENDPEKLEEYEIAQKDLLCAKTFCSECMEETEAAGEGCPGKKEPEEAGSDVFEGPEKEKSGTGSFDSSSEDVLSEYERIFHNRLPLYGCAFNGAATMAVHLTDAIIIAHGPRACAFYTLQNITSSGRKNLFNRGILMPSALHPHFQSTDIGQSEAVFGGMDLLREKVKEAIARRPGAVVVISSCVSGIIGDDIAEMETLSTPECPVLTIPADGDIAGDYMHGIQMCMDTIAEKLIDPTVKPEGKLVNIINEIGVSNNIDVNFRVVREMLDGIGVGVNCRYLGDATAEEMRYFLRAPLNIIASKSEDSLARQKWLMEKYGCRFLEEAFPVGFEDSARWLMNTAAFFDEAEKSGAEQSGAADAEPAGNEDGGRLTERAKAKIMHEQRIYEEEIEALKPQLAGKTILMTTINANLDWMMDAAVKAGMRFLWIGVLNYLRQELNITSHPEYCDSIESNYDWKVIREKIDTLQPDLVLSNYTQTMNEGTYVQDSIPMTPLAGFHSAVPILKRWAKLFEAGKEGSWKDDRALFEKYFS